MQGICKIIPKNSFAHLLKEDFSLDIGFIVGYIPRVSVWWRVGLIFAGTFIFLLGVGKAMWAVYSWGKLSELGQRAPLVGNDPRVSFRLELAIAAFGAAVVAVGILL